MSIARWCLWPVKITQLGFDEFCRIVTTRRSGIGQHQRLQNNKLDEEDEEIGCRAK